MNKERKPPQTSKPETWASVAASRIIDAQTRPIVLLGHPVSHSISPQLQNHALRITAKPFVYLAADVPPSDLAAAVDGLRALGYRGANVTIPHKRSVVSFVDSLRPSAIATGAVNTIICDRVGEQVRLTGDNTDVTGFVAPLKPYLSTILGETALVLGAGGAARAVVYGLISELGLSRVIVAARDPARASTIASDLQFAGARIDAVSMSDVLAVVPQSKLVVNATPLGMDPAFEESPLGDAAALTSDHIVYDLVYRPRATRLLLEAAEQGAITIDGVEMLIGQAAAAFELWTGDPMPLQPVRRLAEDILEG